MKLIDEKGKIFGKLNVIDLVVAIVLLAVVAVLGMKLSGVGGGDGGLGNATKLTYTVKVCNVDAEVYQAIEARLPDQLMASGDLLQGNVVAVDAEPSQGGLYNVQKTTEGTVDVKTREKDAYDLIFTIEAMVKNDVMNEVGTQEVRIGKSHIVKTVHFELNDGIILSCEWENGTGS